jgi:hypothetical protein
MIPMKASVAVALVVTAVLAANAQRVQQEAYPSPDQRFKALVYTSDGESRVSVVTAKGSQLATHAFTSDDNQHGYEVDGAFWTPDSQYFVFRLRSSGVHSPMFAPIVFWKRTSTSFNSLKNYTGDIAFGVAPPDQVKASNYPGMTDATIALHTLTSADLVHIER